MKYQTTMKEIFTFITRPVQISGMLLYVFLNKITDYLQLECPLSACNGVKGKIFLSNNDYVSPQYCFNLFRPRLCINTYKLV